VEEKRELLEAYAAAEAAGETMDAFARRHGVSTASLCKWRKALRTQGEVGLAPKPNPRNASGPHRGQFSYTPEQRRAAVEAFAAAGQTVEDFARLWGVSRATLSLWVRTYRRDGPKALESIRRGRPPLAAAAHGAVDGAAHVARRLAAPLRRLIAHTRDRFKHFGLRKIRDYLRRFHGVKVSTGGVKSALLAEGRVAAQPRPKRVRRAPPAVRRFERAKPMQLWQTDITSFLIGAHRERAYLTVFLDDMSRFVVSFALHLQQRGELVIEALKDGIARFGKPKEVLSDQGRQYFAWRGQSGFQQLLKREGIQHVVARSHHPQTVGKCERLWETVKVEFLDRVVLADLNDARTRLAHYIAHYNFFRPHQGIEGLVPADRFFGAQEALRETQAKQLSQQELALALNEAPRAPVFLFGQIGEEKVALHGERGRLVIQTEDGGRRELALQDLGASAAPRSTPPASMPSPMETEGTSERIAALATKTGEAGRDPTDSQSEVATDASRTRSPGGAISDGGGVAAGDGHEPAGDDSERGERAGASRSEPAEAPTPRREAGEVSTSAAAAAAGACLVDGGERRAEAAGAQDVLGDARLLAREDREAGGGRATWRERPAGVAAQPAGACGDGGGPLEAAADAAGRPAAAGSGGGSGDSQAQDRLAAAGGSVGGAAGGSLERPAGAPSERDEAGE
jgi:transposase InsO family protein